MLLSASFVAWLVTSSLAAAVPATHELHEKRSSLNPRWTKARRVPREATMPMRNGLTQNMDDAEQHLMDV
jgi:tripeptidyl-peptidase I